MIWSCCVSLILPQWLCTPRSSRVLKGWSLYFYSVSGVAIFLFYSIPSKTLVITCHDHFNLSIELYISYLLQTLRDDDDPSVTAISPHHNISSNLIAMSTGTDDLLFTSTTSWSWYFFRSLVFQQMRDETIWVYRYMDLKGFNEIWVGPCVDQTKKRALNIEIIFASYGFLFSINMVFKTRPYQLLCPRSRTWPRFRQIFGLLENKPLVKGESCQKEGNVETNLSLPKFLERLNTTRWGKSTLIRKIAKDSCPRSGNICCLLL